MASQLDSLSECLQLVTPRLSRGAQPRKIFRQERGDGDLGVEFAHGLKICLRILIVGQRRHGPAFVGRYQPDEPPAPAGQVTVTAVDVGKVSGRQRRTGLCEAASSIMSDSLIDGRPMGVRVTSGDQVWFDRAEFLVRLSDSARVKFPKNGLQPYVDVCQPPHERSVVNSIGVFDYPDGVSWHWVAARSDQQVSGRSGSP